MSDTVKAVRVEVPDGVELHLPLDSFGTLWCGDRYTPDAVLEDADPKLVCAVCKTSKLSDRRSGR